MKDDRIEMSGKQDQEPMKRSLYDIFNNAPKCHIAAIAALLGVSEQDLIECLDVKSVAANRCLIDSSHGSLQDANIQTKNYYKNDLSWGPKLKNGHINQDNLHDESSNLESDQSLITIKTALQGLRVAVWESIIPNIRPDWNLQDWIDAWCKERVDHLLAQTIYVMLKRDWQRARLEGQCEAAKIFDYKGECSPIEYLNLERQDALANESAINEFCVAFHKCGITVPDDELNSDAIVEFIESRFDECISEFEDSVSKAMSEVVSDFRIRKED